MCKRCKGLQVKGTNFKFGMEPAFIKCHGTVCTADYVSVKWRKGKNISYLQDCKANDDLLSKLSANEG